MKECSAVAVLSVGGVAIVIICFLPSGTPASNDPTVGHSVAIAVILVVSLAMIVTLVLVLIISRRQLQEAR